MISSASRVLDTKASTIRGYQLAALLLTAQTPSTTIRIDIIDRAENGERCRLHEGRQQDSPEGNKPIRQIC